VYKQLKDYGQQGVRNHPVIFSLPIEMVSKAEVRKAASILGKASWAKGVRRDMVEHATYKRRKKRFRQKQVRNLLPATSNQKRAMALNNSKVAKKKAI
jgi:hypothetical protein